MYPWRHNKVLEVVIELLRAQCESANQQHVTAKWSIILFLKESECPVRKQKIPIWSYLMELVTGKFQRISNGKAAGRCSMIRFKEQCPPHRTDCPLGRKPGGSTRAEEKPIRDTACRLRRKGLDMLCDSYWGWLSCFFKTLNPFGSFKNMNHWLQFESCLKSSSDRGAIWIKLDLVESEKFSAWR